MLAFSLGFDKATVPYGFDLVRAHLANYMCWRSIYSFLVGWIKWTSRSRLSNYGNTTVACQAWIWPRSSCRIPYHDLLYTLHVLFLAHFKPFPDQFCFRWPRVLLTEHERPRTKCHLDRRVGDLFNYSLKGTIMAAKSPNIVWLVQTDEGMSSSVWDIDRYSRG